MQLNVSNTHAWISVLVQTLIVWLTIVIFFIKFYSCRRKLNDPGSIQSSWYKNISQTRHKKVAKAWTYIRQTGTGKWTRDGRIPPNRPRPCNDFALRKIASRSKLTACIDMGGTESLWERRLLVSHLREMETFILGITPAMSIPSNTWRAASVLPFWYSSLPNRALASYKIHRSLSFWNYMDTTEYSKQTAASYKCNHADDLIWGHFVKSEDSPI